MQSTVLCLRVCALIILQATFFASHHRDGKKMTRLTISMMKFRQSWKLAGMLYLERKNDLVASAEVLPSIALLLIRQVKAVLYLTGKPAVC
ncbi:hypothetical protein BJF95_00695 [Rhizobium oryziradicis]|uniref:Uncharacterized protein n=1 Tax=Rhizobium oryziradicis TaxID=1867956 RepID=A0A1Q8ZLC7_9HYPH|nr:hypothetical protein BJF95_00695 [Rhizobium oryziradicis]